MQLSLVFGGTSISVPYSIIQRYCIMRVAEIQGSGIVEFECWISFQPSPAGTRPFLVRSPAVETAGYFHSFPGSGTGGMEARTGRRCPIRTLEMRGMASPAGLEPATLCLEGRCSIHLS